MAQEIECKIMGMTLKEIIALSQKHRLNFIDQRKIEVTDVYWENADGKTIRFRKEIYDKGIDEGLLGIQESKRLDLTIKGSEESDGDKISEREEIILNMNMVPEKDIETFLTRIGFMPARVLIKQRNIFIDADEDSPIRVHHDTLFLGVDTSVTELPFPAETVEWVEIEGDTKGDLYEFLFKMGINREQISNKTTLDILNES